MKSEVRTEETPLSPGERSGATNTDTPSGRSRVSRLDRWGDSRTVPGVNDKSIPAGSVRHFVHEFATPMTVLVLALEQFKDQLQRIEDAHGLSSVSQHDRSSALDSTLDVGSIVDLRETLKSAENATGFLRALLSGLSALSLDGSTARPVDIISANEVVETVVSMLAPLISDRGVTVDVTLLNVDALVAADHLGVQQILVNLMGNAAKFSPADGRISVVVDRDADYIRIAIRDQGPGIADSDFERLLEDGSRLARDADVPGSGVGLHVSALLIAAYGGTLTLESVESGASIVVGLPVFNVPGSDATIPAAGHNS